MVSSLTRYISATEKATVRYIIVIVTRACHLKIGYHKILAFPPTPITITETTKLCLKEFRIFCRLIC